MFWTYWRNRILQWTVLYRKPANNILSYKTTLSYMHKPQLLVATALHDYCKAILVGDWTFGKGLIQSIFELRNGLGVVVTIGMYVTPNHLDINENGLEPDFPQIPALSKMKNHLLQCQI